MKKVKRSGYRAGGATPANEGVGIRDMDETSDVLNRDSISLHDRISQQNLNINRNIDEFSCGHYLFF